MSVKQLVIYHRLLSTHKIVTSKTPMYLQRQMDTSHPYNTRQAYEGGIRFGEKFEVKSNLSRNSFCYSSTLDYNKLPAEIRQSKSVGVFKYKLKNWIKSNIPVD